MTSLVKQLALMDTESQRRLMQEKYKLLNTHIPYTNKRNREAAFAAARKALHLGRHTFTLLLWDKTTGVYTGTDW